MFVVDGEPLVYQGRICNDGNLSDGNTMTRAGLTVETLILICRNRSPGRPCGDTPPRLVVSDEVHTVDLGPVASVRRKIGIRC